MFPQRYIEYMAHFHGTRDYFECHEVLEEHWKETEPQNRDSVWVLLIQLAVALYHFRRKNRKGAAILIDKTIDKISGNEERLLELGIDPEELDRLLNLTKERINNNLNYVSILLPLTESELIKETKDLCREWNVSFWSISNLRDSSLVHKHKNNRS
ncbi:DUF309 domain-containing protein [Halobacillus sp. Marseille-Q1614]|uniref:DUF309 domain-containing protein n=1 Tax=Halobacillus sp. Marseille-Q1614 TaxID=2709134 RepID=UPI00156FEC39|nr:DUF309 domain-containing protein [Halobacillus sp. Marseille-Q1614]